MGKDLGKVISNWNVLNKRIMKLPESDCWLLLKKERKGKRRMQMMMRLHARANVLRNKREREELLK